MYCNGSENNSYDDVIAMMGMTTIMLVMAAMMVFIVATMTEMMAFRFF